MEPQCVQTSGYIKNKDKIYKVDSDGGATQISGTDLKSACTDDSGDQTGKINIGAGGKDFNICISSNTACSSGERKDNYNEKYCNKYLY